MKIQSPWMGRVRGSAGNMTGCKVYDKNVMRAKAFEVNNPNTVAQQVQRGFFAELTKLVTGFTPDQLRTLFPSKPKAMSRRNMLTSQIAENYENDGTEKYIDFSTIDTLGNAPTLDFGTTTVEFGNDNWSVELDENVYQNTDLEDYYFIAILVNETQGKISLTIESALVSNSSLNLNNPSGWLSSDIVHSIPLITDSKTAPTGFGTMSVMKRPVKKSS